MTIAGGSANEGGQGSGERLILVRHARTIQDPARPSEQWGLAEDAPSACAALAKRLSPLAPTRIITSSHGKAFDTGRLLAEELRLPCEMAPGLQEHDRTGVPYLSDQREWLATIERLFSEPDEAVLGTETANRALDRFEAALRREVGARPGETLIVVGHATVMALLVSRHNRMTRREAFAFWKTIGMPEGLLLELPGFELVQRITTG